MGAIDVSQSAWPYHSLMPLQPSPCAETSRPPSEIRRTSVPHPGRIAGHGLASYRSFPRTRLPALLIPESKIIFLLTGPVGAERLVFLAHGRHVRGRIPLDLLQAPGLGGPAREPDRDHHDRDPQHHDDRHQDSNSHHELTLRPWQRATAAPTQATAAAAAGHHPAKPSPAKPWFLGRFGAHGLVTRQYRSI